MITLKKINSPSKTVLDIIKQRIRGSGELKREWEESDHSAIALLHGNPVELLFAADLAQKAAKLSIFELTGSCQFHFSMLVFVGDVASISMAVETVNNCFGKK